MKRLASALALAAVSCLPEPKYPGNEVMGTFALDGKLSDDGCPALEELPRGGLSFNATYSREKDASRTWLTLGGVSSEASFDGQVVASTRTAERRFSECGCGGDVTVVETLTLALLSSSQSQALEGACPGDAVDGGVPAPDADAGLFGPASGPKGFDAVRACGRLVDEVLAAPEGSPACACSACLVRYTLSGGRI